MRKLRRRKLSGRETKVFVEEGIGEGKGGKEEEEDGPENKEVEGGKRGRRTNGDDESTLFSLPPPALLRLEGKPLLSLRPQRPMEKKG